LIGLNVMTNAAIHGDMFSPRPCLFLPSDRVANRPLNDWACALIAAVEERIHTAKSVLSYATEVCALVNQASLINFHAGDVASAEQLCRIQLRWLAASHQATGDAQFVNLAFQPWINLYRLSRMTGMVRVNHENFLRALQLNSERPNPFADEAMSEATWIEISAKDPMCEVNLAQLCFREILLETLERGRYSAALTLLLDPVVQSRISSAALIDGLSLVFCLLRAPDVALALLADDDSHADPCRSRLVLMRRAEAMLCQLDIDGCNANKVIDKVIASCQWLEREATPGEVDMFFRFTTSLEHAQRLAASHQIAKSCFLAYVRLNDEPGVYFAGQVAYRTAAIDRPEFTRAIDRIKSRTSYARIQRFSNDEHRPCSVVALLNTRLRNVIDLK